MFQRVSRCDVWKNGEWVRVGGNKIDLLEGSLSEYVLNELREFIDDGKEVDIQIRGKFADARVWDSNYKARWDITYETEDRRGEAC